MILLSQHLLSRAPGYQTVNQQRFDKRSQEKLKQRSSQVLEEVHGLQRGQGRAQRENQDLGHMPLLG